MLRHLGPILDLDEDFTQAQIEVALQEAGASGLLEHAILR